MRVLVAEDDEGLREVLVLGLADAGYHVDAVERGDDAIDHLNVVRVRRRRHRLADAGRRGHRRRRPGRGRHDRPTALLMLTARDTPADRIQGLDIGRRRLPRQAVRLRGAAGPRPCAAATTARRRRARAERGPAAPRPGHARGAGVDGRDLALTGTEYRILELLMRRSPAVVDRKAIAEHAWADETEPLGSNAIDVQLSRLRAKLPDAGVRIVTVRGAGLPPRRRLTMAARPGRPAPVHPGRARGDRASWRSST